MTVVNRYLTHAVVLALVVITSGYVVGPQHRGTVQAVSIGTSANAAEFFQVPERTPVFVDRSDTMQSPLDMPTSAPPNHIPSTYTVQPGDQLPDLATKFRVSLDQLRWSNPIIATTDKISAGVRLTVPPAPGVVVVTRGGDTVDSLAARYKVDPSAIVEYNRLHGDLNALPAGEELVIPGGVGPLLPTTTVETTGLAPAFVVRNGSFTIHTGAPAGTLINPRFPYGWCTYYVATRRQVTWSGDAYQWYANAQAAGFAVGRTPKAGAIMVTWESGWGHVAYVESVAADGSWIVSEMNYVGFAVTSQRQISPGSVPLIGFIY